MMENQIIQAKLTASQRRNAIKLIAKHCPNVTWESSSKITAHCYKNINRDLYLIFNPHTLAISLSMFGKISPVPQSGHEAIGSPPRTIAPKELLKALRIESVDRQAISDRYHGVKKSRDRNGNNNSDSNKQNKSDAKRFIAREKQNKLRDRAIPMKGIK